MIYTLVQLPCFWNPHPPHHSFGCETLKPPRFDRTSQQFWPTADIAGTVFDGQLPVGLAGELLQSLQIAGGVYFQVGGCHHVVAVGKKPLNGTKQKQHALAMPHPLFHVGLSMLWKLPQFDVFFCGVSSSFPPKKTKGGPFEVLCLERNRLVKLPSAVYAISKRLLQLGLDEQEVPLGSARPKPIGTHQSTCKKKAVVQVSEIWAFTIIYPDRSDRSIDRWIDRLINDWYLIVVATTS